LEKMKAWEEDFSKRYTVSSELIAKGKREYEEDFQKSKYFHPYRDEIRSLEDQLFRQKKLADEEFKKLLLNKYSLDLNHEGVKIWANVPQEIEKSFLDICHDSYKVINESPMGQALSLVDQKMNQISEKHDERLKSIGKEKADQALKILQNSTERIKKETGIDFLNKKLDTEKSLGELDIILRKDYFKISQKYGVREHQSRANLARRKAVAYLEHKEGYPKPLGFWLARKVTIGIAIGLLGGIIWKVYTNGLVKQRDDYYKQLYKKHPEYVIGLGEEEDTMIANKVEK